MLFDAHAHLNFPEFEKDFEKVIDGCQENNVWLINVGVDYETSKIAVEIAENYDKGVFAAIGQHPSEANENLDFKKYKNLAESSEKVVAIGEIGLDYKYKPKHEKEFEVFKQKQKELVLEQIKLAQELGLPVIFHCRMAHKDLTNILELQVTGYKLQAVIHSFTGTLEEAEKYLSLGFYLGFNGIIFRKIKGISFEEIIKKTPINRILVETDCPFLTPPPHLYIGVGATPQENNKRNEPMFVRYIVQKIAEIKGLSFGEIAENTFENARKLFRIF